MTILFIDDDPDDIELYLEAISYLNSTDLFSGTGPLKSLSLTDCRKVKAFLEELPQLPDMIFMDINMPVMSGRDCLTILKDDPKFSHIPVVMLSTTCGDEEVRAFNLLGAVDCVQKPGGFNDLVRVFAKFIFPAR